MEAVELSEGGDGTHDSTDKLAKHDNPEAAQKKVLRDRVISYLDPLTLAHHPPLPEDSSLPQKLKYSLLLPPHGAVANTLTNIIILLLIWSVSFSVLGSLSLPTDDKIFVTVQGGAVFTTLLLLVCAIIGGRLVELMKLPPLLGMLLVGVMLANIPGVKNVGRLDSDWSSVLRSSALTVILIRAGLGLDPAKLRKLSLVVLRLAFLPCLAESAAVMLASHFILGLPWLWALLLGFVLAAVSPAVVVPCLLSLQSRGFGVDKGIPTLVIAAASVDDVLAISCFTILIGIIFNNNDDLTMTILQGPIEVVVGLLYGAVAAVFCIFLPSEPSNTGQRLIMLVGGGLVAIFGLPLLDLPGAGPLAVLVMAFIVGIGWRRQGYPEDNPVTQHLGKLWTLLQPLLFSLIGAEVDVASVEADVVGLAVAVLIIGLVVRLLVSQLAVMAGGLNARERLFVALAWLPKATVQAAIGPLALDKAKSLLMTSYPEHTCVGDMLTNATVTSVCEMVDQGNIILTVSVLVIIITAPLGAVAILLTGPKLLQDNQQQQESKLE